MNIMKKQGILNACGSISCGAGEKAGIFFEGRRQGNRGMWAFVYICDAAAAREYCFFMVKWLIFLRENTHFYV